MKDVENLKTIIFVSSLGVISFFAHGGILPITELFVPYSQSGSAGSTTAPQSYPAQAASTPKPTPVNIPVPAQPKPQAEFNSFAAPAFSPESVTYTEPIQFREPIHVGVPHEKVIHEKPIQPTQVSVRHESKTQKVDASTSFDTEQYASSGVNVKTPAEVKEPAVAPQPLAKHLTTEKEIKEAREEFVSKERAPEHASVEIRKDNAEESAQASRPEASAHEETSEKPKEPTEDKTEKQSVEKPKKHFFSINLHNSTVPKHESNRTQSNQNRNDKNTRNTSNSKQQDAPAHSKNQNR